AVLGDLGLDVAFDEARVAAVVAASGGTLSARPLRDPHLLYDAGWDLTDLGRLPPALFPLVRPVGIVESLQGEAARSGAKRKVPIAWEPNTATVVVDHANLNQVEDFGSFVHPKVNIAMLLEVAIEGRLRAMGPAVLRELGLDIVVDDEEW